jgi:hypothetical protein
MIASLLHGQGDNRTHNAHRGQAAQRHHPPDNPAPTPALLRFVHSPTPYLEKNSAAGCLSGFCLAVTPCSPY